VLSSRFSRRECSSTSRCATSLGSWGDVEDASAIEATGFYRESVARLDSDLAGAGNRSALHCKQPHIQSLSPDKSDYRKLGVLELHMSGLRVTQACSSLAMTDYGGTLAFGVVGQVSQVFAQTVGPINHLNPVTKIIQQRNDSSQRWNTDNGLFRDRTR